MIVFEGPDCIGKTTAVKRLCEMYSWFQYKHMGPPEENFDHVQWYIDNYSDHFVWDRYHLGEEVYGAMLGLSRHADSRTRADVRAWLKKQGCLVVLMYAGSERWLDERVQTGQLYNSGMILRANHCYEQIALLGEWSHVNIDVSKHGFPTDKHLQNIVGRWVEQARTP